MKGRELFENFFNIYGNRKETPVLFFAPGRVNLIGEHTDYNNGFVFPCAINFGTYMCVRKRPGKSIKANSLNFSTSFETDLNNINQFSPGEWINYPLGVINEFLLRDVAVGGLEILYSGDIPNGAGLSSSASIEMATAFALNHLYSTNFSQIEMVKMSQSAENNFVGMNCGIMDQFAVGFGKKDMAIFLNCNNLNYQLVPVELKEYRLVISNTNKRRDLTESKYNERRSECEAAVKFINHKVKIDHLSELTLDEFNSLSNTIPDQVIKKRALHVVSENKRVSDAVEVLRAGKLEEFGRLMNESHDSLRTNYEVTGAELDTLVYEARKLEGVIGSRMTGAGFGGCTISLVKNDETDNFKKSLSDIYTKKTGLIPDFYLPEISSGVERIQ